VKELFRTFVPTSTRMQLYCFPFAGGHSYSFVKLNESLKDHFQVIAIDPPGHGGNSMPLMDTFEGLVQLYVQAMVPRIIQPFVLFGHSMGGMVVFRVAQELEKRGIYPKAVIVSAIHPPDFEREIVSHLDDREFVDYLTSLGGIPAELLKEQELLQFFLPMFRADIRALDHFQPVDRTPLRSALHVFRGKLDHRYYESALGWKEWGQDVQVHDFEGGHMFLLTEPEKVARRIRELVAAEVW
jgi:external thioesterase TEII